MLHTIEKIIFDQKISFEDKVFEILKFQFQHCHIYKEYVNIVGSDIGKVNRIEDIPFLPISFFKTHTVLIEGMKASIVFGSSSTTGALRSYHHVADKSLFNQTALLGWQALGATDAVIIALLPNYLERQDSSLIYMVSQWMQASPHPLNGYFMYADNVLIYRIQECIYLQLPIVLIGVSYALIDLCEIFCSDYSNITIIETGGMKGRKEEITRQQLHLLIVKSFPNSKVMSEYGMTELLSQAYFQPDREFVPIATMKVLIREINDPFTYTDAIGCINVIDIANVYSCSFIETEDLGRMKDRIAFEVLGRLDHSDMRGCNLL